MIPRRLLPGILVGLLVLGTLVAVLAAARYERDHARDRARLESERAGAVIGFGMNGARESLDDVAGLFDASDQVTRADFAWLGQRVLAHGRLESLAWAPRVAGPHGDRYPVAYYTSAAGGVGPIGIDEAAQPVTRLALTKAVMGGAAVMTPPVWLSEAGKDAILVFQPVYRRGGTPPTPAARGRALLGVIVGAFDMQEMTRRAETVVAPGLTNALSDGDVTIWSSPGGPPHDGARVAIPVMGRTWTVTVGEPAASWRLPLVILVAGTALSLLALAILVILFRRDRFARAAVRTATEDLRESRARQRALVENSPDIVARYDAGLRCLYANAAIERATGRPPSAFVGRNLDEAGLPDDMVTVLAGAIMAVIATGEEGETDYSVIGADGMRAMHARLAPELAEDGTVESVLVLSREVTEQRAAEAALRAGEERYRSIVATMSDGLILQGPRGEIVACNPAAECILGLSTEQMMGRASVDPRWRAVREDGSPFPGEEHPAMVTLRTGEPQRDVVMGVHKPDGTLTWISVASEPIVGDGDVSVVCCFSDVTARRQNDREQAALRRIATMVAAAQGAPGRVFAHVAREAADLVGAETAAVVRFDAGRLEGTVMGVHAPLGTAVPDDGATAALDPGTATGAVAATGEAAHRLGGPHEPGHPAGAPPISAAAAPIVVDGQVWGAVSAATTLTGPLHAGAGELLARLAELAALAIMSASARDQLATLAATDHLTGLWNRRVFQERLAGEIERARRYDRPMSLVVLDIDHFKQVNDQYGHPTGDRVLIEVASRLFATVREGETVARIGGEEFAWILPETDGDGAIGAAERARRAIEDRPFAGVGALTISLGVCDLDEAETAGELVRLADKALYAAKAQGRNRVARHAPPLAAAPHEI